MHHLISREPSCFPFWKQIWTPYWLNDRLVVFKSLDMSTLVDITKNNMTLVFNGTLSTIYIGRFMHYWYHGIHLGSLFKSDFVRHVGCNETSLFTICWQIYDNFALRGPFWQPWAPFWQIWKFSAQLGTSILLMQLYSNPIFISTS